MRSAVVTFGMSGEGEGAPTYTKGRTIARWLCSALQLALLCFIVAFQCLATSRAGLARHVTARSVQLEQALDTQLLVRVLACVVVLLSLVVLASLFRRNRLLRLSARVEAALLAPLCIALLLFALVFSREELRAYYYLLAAFLLIVCLQAGKCLLAGRSAPSSASTESNEPSSPTARGLD